MYSGERSSAEAQREHIQLGTGAMINVRADFRYKPFGRPKLKRKMENLPTRRGNQFAQRAHERMTSRKPAARMNDRRMTAVFSLNAVRGVDMVDDSMAWRRW